jgi:hypothetical protein
MFVVEIKNICDLGKHLREILILIDRLLELSVVLFGSRLFILAISEELDQLWVFLIHAISIYKNKSAYIRRI